MSAVALPLLAAPLRGQDADSLRIGVHEVFAAGEMEEYLRFLQIGGSSALYPWSIRAFSPGELDRLAPKTDAHPWAARYSLGSDTTGAPRFDLLRPSLDLVYNSAFPHGGNDGPVWAGRGLTTALRFGVSARYGPLSLVLAPTVFRAQNAEFDLAENGLPEELRFADPLDPLSIDLPQRFGDDAYVRVDPGQSTLRLDARGVAVGVSTANQQWGPASRLPILLGNNAGGFPHLFVGTSSPANVFVGRVHARLVWGRLEQSAYSTVGADSATRFMSGLVATFVPRGVPGLELGLGRFFHSVWPDEGLDADYFLRPVNTFFKAGTADPNDTIPAVRSDNQLVSVFARWAFPESGVEVYGEYGREDANWDLRDFLVEPDHVSGYMLGLRKLWRHADRRFLTLRGELLNTQVSHLARVRAQGPFYRHTYARQGHTHRGQLLGAASGYGGGGWFLGGDYYHPGGRWSGFLARDLRNHQGVTFAPSVERDVLYSLGGESLLFRGRFDVLTGLTGVYEYNRDLRGNAFNLNLTLRVDADL